MDIVKFLRTAFFIENLWWLLLTVLPEYSKVSWGVCSQPRPQRIFSL